MRYLLLLLLLTAPAYAQSFDHGVASGDPTESSVILWTRLSGVLSPANVGWWVGPHPDGSAPYSDGETLTGASEDYTVKVDVRFLQPATTYYYGFSYEGIPSQVGRTRTAPTGTADRLRIAVASCAQWEQGYFAAYRHLASKDLDAVLHLGDYIYEMAPSGKPDTVRPFEPAREIVTLADYRARYASYRSDPDLQAAHAAHPWVFMYDDHEFANNATPTGSVNHDPATEGPWGDRVAAAFQAMSEWLPIRDVSSTYRRVPFGGLLDLFVLDTRMDERDEQVPWSRGALAIMSDEQHDWLIGGLASSSARWRLVASPVPVFPQLQRIRKTEAWEGFPEARARLFQDIRMAGVDNLVFASGDIHSAWATDLPDDFALYSSNPGAGSVAAEFVAPGIAATSLVTERGIEAQAEANIANTSPHVRAFDLRRSGYVVLTVDAARVRGAFYFVNRLNPLSGETLGFAYEVRAGEAVLRPTTERQARPRRTPSPGRITKPLDR